MNPISFLAYTIRHKRQICWLSALFTLAVIGLYVFIGLAQETYITPAFTINRYLEHFSLVQPNLVEALDPAVAGQILANPDVAQLIPQNNVRVKVANVGGAYFNFRLFGLRQEDIAVVLEECGVVLKAGTLPHPGTNEVALSEEIATALKLEPGDTIDRTVDEKLYRNIGAPLQIAGILSGETRLGILSYEYLAGEGGAANAAVQGWMVFAQPGRQSAVADFLRQTIRSDRVNTYTYQSTSEQIERDQRLLYILGLPVVMLISIATAMIVAAIQRVIFQRRLTEFGTLYALGYDKKWLAFRLTKELALPIFAGLGLGSMLGYAVMAILSSIEYAPHGFALQPFVPTALLLIAPFPFIIIGYLFVSIYHAIKRLDTVSIIERGELSLERSPSVQKTMHKRDYLPRPLSPITYYTRHTCQAAVMIVAMTLMVVAATLVIFIFAAGSDALQPMLTNFSKISAVSPNGQPLDDTVIDQIRAYPATARVIPVYDFSPLRIAIPPMFPDRPIETLCVSAEDMAHLVALYHLELAEGHLPRQNSNEIVLPWGVAKNRDIQIGDVIGNRDHPIYPDAPSLPVELVVSGIFAPAERYTEETWLSFMSLEFVDAYRESDLSIIIVPQDGQKEALDAWLETKIASQNRLVYTYRNQRAALQKEMKTMLLTFSLMVGAIMLVTVLILAGLQYTFISQRKTEFGILNALGMDRRQLITRLLGETLFTSGAAWTATVIVCLAILYALQHLMFNPIGLRFEYLQFAPWVFTLLTPIGLTLVSAATAHGMLSRMDAITLIERRD